MALIGGYAIEEHLPVKSRQDLVETYFAQRSYVTAQTSQSCKDRDH
jgi:hypothetical protein